MSRRVAERKTAADEQRPGAAAAIAEPIGRPVHPLARQLLERCGMPAGLIAEQMARAAWKEDEVACLQALRSGVVRRHAQPAVSFGYKMELSPALPREPDAPGAAQFSAAVGCAREPEVSQDLAERVRRARVDAFGRTMRHSRQAITEFSPRRARSSS